MFFSDAHPPGCDRPVVRAPPVANTPLTWGFRWEDNQNHVLRKPLPTARARSVLKADLHPSDINTVFYTFVRLWIFDQPLPRYINLLVDSPNFFRAFFPGNYPIFSFFLSFNKLWEPAKFLRIQRKPPTKKAREIMIIIMITMIRMIIRLEREKKKATRRNRETLMRKKSGHIRSECFFFFCFLFFRKRWEARRDIKFREADWFWLRNGLASVTGIKNDLKRRRRRV